MSGSMTSATVTTDPARRPARLANTDGADSRPLPSDETPLRLSDGRDANGAATPTDATPTGGHERRTAQIGGHGAKLPHLREAAIAALIAEPSVEAAAQAAGVADSTLRRWLQDPDFRRDYDAARRRTLDAALRELQAGMTAATRTLVAIMGDDAKPPAARVTAARAIIDAAFRGTELLDVLDRLDKMETTLEAAAASRAAGQLNPESERRAQRLIALVKGDAEPDA